MISFITVNNASISLYLIVLSKIYSELTVFKYILSWVCLPIPPCFEPLLPLYSSLIFYADLPVFSVARLAYLSLCIYLFVYCVGSFFINLSIYLSDLFSYLWNLFIFIWLFYEFVETCPVAKLEKYAIVLGCKLISSSHWPVPRKICFS